MSMGKVFLLGVKENFRGVFKIVAIILICIIPLLYSFFYLKAFWDPYNSMSNLPVAVVNEDTGTSDINFGNDLVKNLQGSEAVQWHFVDRSTADAGLQNNTYYAEFIIPADFSQSVASGMPDTAKIELYVDSKNNFIAPLLAKQVESQMTTSLSQQISQQAVQTMLQSLANGGQQLQAGAQGLSAAAQQLANGGSGTTDAMTTIAQSLQQAVKSDPSLAQNPNIAAALQAVSTYQSSISSQSGGSPIVQFVNAANTYAAGAAQYAASVSALNAGSTAAFIAAPVTGTITDLEPVPYYGTGFAPYFTSLSLWIGALLMPMVIGIRFGRNRELWEQTNSFCVGIGRFLVFACVGVVQSFLLTLVVKALGIAPKSWLMVFFTFVITSFTCIAIIIMLISLLRRLGQLISMVILVFQLSSCAGTFPLPLTSTHIFTAMHPFMPFTYSVNALREAIDGSPINAGVYWQSLATLVLMIIICLAIYILLRRPCDLMMVNLSAWLRKKAEQQEAKDHAKEQEEPVTTL